MPGNSVLNPHPPELERFLYAAVGKDRNGHVVTVLSALARLDLDPWTEAAELASLRPSAAHARIALLCSKFRDIPALKDDTASVAQDLSLLLPERGSLLDRATALERAAAGPEAAKGRLAPATAVWALLAILLVLMQMILASMTGSGE